MSSKNTSGQDVVAQPSSEQDAGWLARQWVFIFAYIRSMRLYYAFVTGISGWIGVAFARHLHPELTSPFNSAVVLALLFLSWGVNQIFNDYLGLPEDRVNAPRRPMVTGQLPAGKAMIVSFVLIIATGVTTWFLSPWAIVPLVLGVLLNVAYEYAKAIPVVGNIVFGVMISMCTAYGYIATLREPDIIFTSSRLSVLGLVAIMNGLMTYYTYFKDYEGDLRAGKRTAVVVQGIEKSRRVAAIVSVLPSVAFAFIYSMGLIEAKLNNTFGVLFAATLLQQLYTGYLYYRHPTGERAYKSLKANIRACVCGQVMLMALFNPELAMYLYVAAYLFVGFLFNMHRDSKA